MVAAAKLGCGLQRVLVLAGEGGGVGDGVDSGLYRDAGGRANNTTTDSRTDGREDGRTNGEANGGGVGRAGDGANRLGGDGGGLDRYPGWVSGVTWTLGAVAWWD